MTHALQLTEAQPIIEVSRLDEIAELLRLLHEADVEYCHWKSNEHLRASLLGQTDLDILVAPRHAQPLARLLAGTRFKRFLTAPPRRYPGIESYVGLDDRTGCLIHLHLHYQLTLGERNLKGYRLPWEHLLLSRRTYSELEGIYVADPQMELLLLVIRAALKVRARDQLLALLGRPPISPGVLTEFRWLAGRVDRSRLADLAGGLVGEPAARLLDDLVAAPPPTRDALARFRERIVPPLEEYRTYRPFEAPWRRWTREFQLLRAPRLRSPQGGLVIVMLGADGSGKSTLTRELTGWLRRNLDVASVYFGSGQGPVSLPRRMLQRGAALFKRARPSAKASAPAERRGAGLSKLRTIGELLWVASLALERRRRAARARRLRNQGAIVLCDRFPQSQSPGNDGPWLGHWLDHPSWARRKVAQMELAAIQYVERLRPGLVLSLGVTREVALQRKPETPHKLLDARMRVLEQLHFSGETRVANIDATRPLEEVLRAAKREIWSCL
jgi:thymidylate kinase